MTLGVLTCQWPMIEARRHDEGARALFDSFFKGLKGLTEGTRELKIHYLRCQDHLRCQEFLRQGLEGPLVGIQKHALRVSTTWRTASSSSTTGRDCHLLNQHRLLNQDRLLNQHRLLNQDRLLNQS